MKILAIIIFILILFLYSCLSISSMCSRKEEQEKRLNHVVDYVSNPKKTTGDSKDYQELHQFSEYENLSFNTEEECYISGVNCLPDDDYEDMMDTKRYWKKKDFIRY